MAVGDSHADTYQTRHVMDSLRGTQHINFCDHWPKGNSHSKQGGKESDTLLLDTGSISFS